MIMASEGGFSPTLGASAQRVLSSCLAFVIFSLSVTPCELNVIAYDNEGANSSSGINAVRKSSLLEVISLILLVNNPQ
jgi:hypothetical protein